ncbi:MAG: addiction module protein [Planctomycetales bacterium]|nr:addiction module protein [Planctomycetales bacterium]
MRKAVSTLNLKNCCGRRWRFPKRNAANSLIESLDPPPDDDTDSTWAEEICQRIESIENGEMNLIPWDDVMRELSERRHA